MSSSAQRLILLLALLVGGLLAAGGANAERADSSAARWPTDDSVYTVQEWSAGPLAVLDTQLGDRPGALLSRAYRHDADAVAAQFALWTVPQPRARMLFRKGPDRDYLGAGYVTEPAPLDLVPPAAGRDVIVARRGTESVLLVYAYGERRGLLGAGPMAWLLAELDAILDARNDYFLARVAVRFDDDPRIAQAATSLADALFPRVASWYQA
jgi:hypothetical protein